MRSWGAKSAVGRTEQPGLSPSKRFHRHQQVNMHVPMFPRRWLLDLQFSSGEDFA
jgi:hypothetical protein